MIVLKRLSVILALLAAVAVFLVLPILAQNTVYFTAINNTLLELDEQTMPIMENGTIYLPSTVFNSSELGTYCLYSRNKQQVVISDLDKILYYDMSAGSSYDDRDTTYPYAAIYHNDTAYIPAFFTASFFAIQVSYIRNDYAPIVRLTKGSVLSDSDFLRGAASIMETRLAQYQSAQSAATDPIQTVRPSAVPVITPVPTATPEPAPTPRPDRSDVEVYIAFLGFGESSEACADILRSKGYTPCFFLRPEDIRRYPESIRKLNGIGCGIGLLFSDDPQEEYREFSELLRESVRSVSFLIASAQTLSADALDKAQNTGLILWCAQEPDQDINALIERLDETDGRFDLILDANVSVNRITRLANYLRSESYTVNEITELTETTLNKQEERVG